MQNILTLHAEAVAFLRQEDKIKTGNKQIFSTMHKALFLSYLFYLNFACGICFQYCYITDNIYAKHYCSWNYYEIYQHAIVDPASAAYKKTFLS